MRRIENIEHVTNSRHLEVDERLAKTIGIEAIAHRFPFTTYSEANAASQTRSQIALRVWQYHQAEMQKASPNDQNSTKTPPARKRQAAAASLTLPPLSIHSGDKFPAAH